MVMRGTLGRDRSIAWVSTVWAILALCVAGCTSKPGSSAATKPAAPAKVEKLPAEGDLIAVTLKPEAEQRLGIVLASVAPQTGTLVIAEGGVAPSPGLAVKKDQPIFTLLPILSADRAVLTPIERVNFEQAKTTAEGTLKQARNQFEQDKILLERTEGLVKVKAAPATALVDARATYDRSKLALEAAEQTSSIFQKALGTGAEDAGKLAPLMLRAPADGVLLNVNVQPGQQVPAGSVLFEVANLDPVYVKVPVFVGEEEAIATDKDATVGGLADAPGKPTRPGKPVRTTPSANALAATTDLYYSVENHDGRLRPGQKVGVTLPLQGEAESLVVPHAAVLRDFSGGAWVYQAMGNHVFARKRVVVDHVVGTDAVLAMGPKPGTKVVTDGAAELFGTEFGGGK